MHETRGGMRAGLATVMRRSALDDVHAIVLLVIAVTLPSPAMWPPRLHAGIRPVVCLFPVLGGPECFASFIVSDPAYRPAELGSARQMTAALTR